jgi:hypothetical protein
MGVMVDFFLVYTSDAWKIQAYLALRRLLIRNFVFVGNFDSDTVSGGVDSVSRFLTEGGA